MDSREDHEANRKKICDNCFDRAILVIEKNSFHEKLVKDFILLDFSYSNNHLPCGLCSNCLNRLRECARGDFTRTLPKKFIHEEMHGFRPTRKRPFMQNV